MIQEGITDVGKMTNVVRKLRVCKPYAAPWLLRLDPALMKRRLLRNADTTDTELKRLIDSVDQLHGANGS